MRKSTLFISTALTIFVLAVMFGVVSAYQDNVNAKDTAEQVTAEPVVEQAAAVETMPTAPAAPTVISPEQAALIASEFMGDTDMYGAEVVVYEGAPAFLVTFSSGNLVYIGSTGEILAISQLEPVVVMAPATQNNNNNGGNSNNNRSEHDDHDDDHDDD
ncbi:MAG TPA: hypothetical protein VJ972_04815 [Anaerolineales bacterium]|nr:hypothetical protein [Anaerolineales bacterium]